MKLRAAICSLSCCMKMVPKRFGAIPPCAPQLGTEKHALHCPLIYNVRVTVFVNKHGKQTWGGREETESLRTSRWRRSCGSGSAPAASRETFGDTPGKSPRPPGSPGSLRRQHPGRMLSGTLGVRKPTETSAPMLRYSVPY